jgi:hypothetical protein
MPDMIGTPLPGRPDSMVRMPRNFLNRVLIAAVALSLAAVTAGISPAASAAGRPPAHGAIAAAALWFNPATGREQSLIKHPRGRAGAIGFVPYGPPNADIIIFVACPAGPAASVLGCPGAVEVAPGQPRT